MKKNNSKKGFSLVELSIVLIIIGLLIAGVTGGRSLIRQAQLQSVIRDVNSYQTAFRTFQAAYDQIPGNLTTIIGTITISITTTSPVSTAGNGNLEIDTNGINAWANLGQADIFASSIGNVTAKQVFGSTNRISAHSPDSKIKGASIYITTDNSDNFFAIGGGDDGTTGSLTPIESLTLDNKIDDGVNNSGFVTSGAIDRATPTACSYTGTTNCVLNFEIQN